ncbi:MAG: hypothetical protein GY841_16315 [FCB group bacterium]|nr:hypothetical protein [FCB group bacterium]
MKIAVLTTDTTHHQLFCQELHKFHPISRVIFGTEKLPQKFDTSHPIHDRQSALEAPFVDRDISEYIPTEKIPYATLEQFTRSFDAGKPNIIFVYGARKIPADVCHNYNLVNFHGGDSQKYRGKDALWWSIYHDDWDALKVTCHFVAPKLDTGNILYQDRVPIGSEMKLFEMRKAVVDVCLSQAKRLIMYSRRQAFSKYFARMPLSSPQMCEGRYYSSMPPQLITICAEKFERYTGKL